MMFRSLCLAVVCAGQCVLAQEISVYRVSATPGPWNARSSTLGLSLGASMPIAPGSKVQVGLRVSTMGSRDSITTDSYCLECFSPQPPLTFRVRLQTTQVALLLIPYATRNTRVDVGVGQAYQRFHGDLENNLTSSFFTLGLSRRVVRGLPIWATVGFERIDNDKYDQWPADSFIADTPADVLRFGLLLRR